MSSIFSRTEEEDEICEGLDTPKKSEAEVYSPESSISSSTDVSSSISRSETQSTDISRTSKSWGNWKNGKDDKRFSKIPLDLRFTPFFLRWTYGVNINVPLLNITSLNRPVICFAAGIAGGMYDYVSNQMRLLHGHVNAITTMATDLTGNWLVTADSGPDSSVIVWDTLICRQINVLKNPFIKGTAVVGMSPCAKYIIAVSSDFLPIVKLWAWTYDSANRVEDSYKTHESYGSVVQVAFHPNVSEHVMIAFQHQVLFLCIKDNKLISQCAEPKVRYKKIGIIKDCTFIEFCHECVASTSTGCLLIYSSSWFTRKFREQPLSNEKIFIKSIKVCKHSINCIKSTDQILATVDDRGQILFFGKSFKLLFWLHYEIGPIQSISFSLYKQKYRIVDLLTDAFDEVFVPFNNDISNDFVLEYEDKVDEYEHVFKHKLPSDTTLDKNPFIIRDFCLSTSNGQLFYMHFVKNKLEQILYRSDDIVAGIDTHSEREYLCIAYQYGRVVLYNYMTHEKISETNLPFKHYNDTGEPVAITALKYSPEGLHLACGRDNGEIWLLEPILMTPKYKKPLRSTKYAIKKFAFSANSSYLAYIDQENTTCLFWFDAEAHEWVMNGKVRAHYKEVNDIVFSPYCPPRLFTISDDRFLIEYDIPKSSMYKLEIRYRERIEQTVCPKCFIYQPQEKGSDQHYLLMVDNQYKYKLINDETFMTRRVVLGPSYGCYQDHHIHTFEILSARQEKYLVFLTDKHMGIQRFPVDCSPYTYIGLVAHQSLLKSVCTSVDGNYIFSFGANDSCVFMWKINFMSLDALLRCGGEEFQPYYCLIEGGKNGWLFGEMQDLFYYMQILHQGENTMMPRQVSDYIPLKELPDLMRACGFYPSDFEIENLIVDVKYSNYDITGVLKYDVSFLEFVKLFINHRPTSGIKYEFLEEQFNILMQCVDDPQLGYISRDAFVESLCTKGEPFNVNNIHKCLAILMRYEDDVEDGEKLRFNFLPEEISFEVFTEEILGIDMNKQMMDNPKTSEVDDNKPEEGTD